VLGQELLCSCGFDSVLMEKQRTFRGVDEINWHQKCETMGLIRNWAVWGGGKMGISAEGKLLVQLHDTCDVIWRKEIRTLRYGN
jgi:hypothetical protein